MPKTETLTKDQEWDGDMVLPPAQDEEEEDEPIRRLNQDLLDAAEKLTPHEVRYIVRGYYTLQEYRKATKNQVRALTERQEPNLTLAWFAIQSKKLEGQVARALGRWAETRPDALWSMSHVGVGAILAANYAAAIKIWKAPTAGHIWRFAGLDPTVEWFGRDKVHEIVRLQLEAVGGELARAVAGVADELGRNPELLLRQATFDGALTQDSLVTAAVRRPWNADLKTVTWKTSDCFVKNMARPDCYYGPLYAERKAMEVKRNEEGAHADVARRELETRRLSAESKRYYRDGKFPPGRVDLMARRWTVKLFLAHLQHVMWELRYGEPPPKPYVIEQMGHTHILAPPNWPDARLMEMGEALRPQLEEWEATDRAFEDRRREEQRAKKAKGKASKDGDQPVAASPNGNGDAMQH